MPTTEDVELRAALARWFKRAFFAVALAAAGVGVGYALWHRMTPLKHTITTDPFVAPCTFCAEPNSSEAKHLVAEPSRLAVDANGAASGVVTVCNKGAAAEALDLALDDFHGLARDDTPYPIGTARDLTIDGRNASETTALAAGKCINLKIDVTRLWQAGLMTANLRNGPAKLATLKATNTQVPFHLKVDGATPEKVTVTFRRGHVSRIWLRNDDPMTYRFRWRLELGDFVETGHEWVEPNRRVGLPVELDCSQYSFFESGFLRSGAKSGNLFVEFEPDPSMKVLGTPSKRFDVEARLNYWGETTQRIFNYVLVLVVLILGILLSLVINYALPVQGKRVAAKQRLVDLEGRLGGLEDVIDSRILSLLRVEKKRLRQALRELWPIFPSTDGLLQKLDERIGGLEKRIELTVKVGDILATIADATNLAPEEEDEIGEHCRAVLRVVEKPLPTQQEIDSAESELAKARGIRESAESPPSVERVHALGEWQTKIPDKLGSLLIVDELRKSFDDLLAALRKDFLEDKTSGPMREYYVRAARAVRKAELLIRFVHLLDASPNDDIRAHRTKRKDDLLAALEPGSGESLERAGEVVREAEQNIDGAVVEGEIRSHKPTIKVDPPKPFPYQLVTLRLSVEKPGLETAVARKEIKCKWKIGDEELDEEDWIVCTYFESETAGTRLRNWLRPADGRARIVNVHATLKDAKDDVLAEVDEKIKVEELKSYVESRTMLAIATLAITVTIVGIGLLAGALEKLQGLDWIAGFLAIVAIGFGADLLKKIITRS